jgi:hypothetical protein
VRIEASSDKRTFLAEAGEIGFFPLLRPTIAGERLLNAEIAKRFVDEQ